MVAYDGRKNLSRAAVDFPFTLESLDWMVDSLRSEVDLLVKGNVEKTETIERLTVANERLTDARQTFRFRKHSRSKSKQQSGLKSDSLPILSRLKFSLKPKPKPKQKRQNKFPPIIHLFG